jgi:hypothetical protein
VQGLNSASDDQDFLLSVELTAQDIHPDDEIDPNATVYAGPIQLSESSHLRSRVLDVVEWSPLETATYGVGPVTESLRITEVHYHPGSATDSEFIELKNIGTETLQLNLVKFTNGIDFTFPSVALAPGQVVVVVADLAVFESVYGTGIDVVGVYQGRLNNGGERIRIEDALGETILEFDFADSWYVQTDGGDYSLTFLDSSEVDLTRWSRMESWAPSSISGGTPGEDDEGPFATFTPTETPSLTPTPSPTETPSPSPTFSETPTQTETWTASETPTFTETSTENPTETPTPTDSSPTPTPTETFFYDWTGEGDVNSMDLMRILADPPSIEYLYGFAVHWHVPEGGE